MTPTTIAEVEQRLMEPLRRSQVRMTRKTGGTFRSLKHGDVERELNRVFGATGWSTEIVSTPTVTEIAVPSPKGEVIGYQSMAEVCVRLMIHPQLEHCHYSPASPLLVHEDFGHGDGEFAIEWNEKDKPESGMKLGVCAQYHARKKATKSAKSDAIKRCAKTLGAKLGIAIYMDPVEARDQGYLIDDTLNGKPLPEAEAQAMVAKAVAAMAARADSAPADMGPFQRRIAHGEVQLLARIAVLEAQLAQVKRKADLIQVDTNGRLEVAPVVALTGGAGANANPQTLAEIRAEAAANEIAREAPGADGNLLRSPTGDVGGTVFYAGVGKPQSLAEALAAERLAREAPGTITAKVVDVQLGKDNALAVKFETPAGPLSMSLPANSDIPAPDRAPEPSSGTSPGPAQAPSGGQLVIRPGLGVDETLARHVHEPATVTFTNPPAPAESPGTPPAQGPAPAQEAPKSDPETAKANEALQQAAPGPASSGDAVVENPIVKLGRMLLSLEVPDDVRQALSMGLTPRDVAPGGLCPELLPDPSGEELGSHRYSGEELGLLLKGEAHEVAPVQDLKKAHEYFVKRAKPELVAQVWKACGVDPKGQNTNYQKRLAALVVAVKFHGAPF